MGQYKDRVTIYEVAKAADVSLATVILMSLKKQKFVLKKPLLA